MGQGILARKVHLQKSIERIATHEVHGLASSRGEAGDLVGRLARLMS